MEYRPVVTPEEAALFSAFDQLLLKARCHRRFQLPYVAPIVDFSKCRLEIWEGSELIGAVTGMERAKEFCIESAHAYLTIRRKSKAVLYFFCGAFRTDRVDDGDLQGMYALMNAYETDPATVEKARELLKANCQKGELCEQGEQMDFHEPKGARR